MSEAHSTCASKEKPVEYRDIPGFMGYRVGSDGTVWSCLSGQWKQMPGHYNDERYRRVMLRGDCGYIKKYVHRLVLEAFIGPCPAGMEALHFPDICRHNNALSNLSWGTRQENLNQLGPSVKERHWRRLTPRDADEIRSLALNGASMRSLAARFGITHTHVRRILRGKAWKS